MGQFNLQTQKGLNWFNRAEVAAKLILGHAQQGARIGDLGCGDQKLRALLGDWAHSYQGFDLIPQSSDVIAIDITTDDLPTCDVSVLLGVLEYVPIEPVLMKVASPLLVVSHLYPDQGAFSEELIREKGWLNLLPKADFESLLEQCGFEILEVIRTPDGEQHVWLARRLGS